MGKKGKRGIALVLCFLWITAMPVFAAGTEQPSGEKDGQETAVVLPEESVRDLSSSTVRSLKRYRRASFCRHFVTNWIIGVSNYVESICGSISNA